MCNWIEDEVYSKLISKTEALVATLAWLRERNTIWLLLLQCGRGSLLALVLNVLIDIFQELALRWKDCCREVWRSCSPFIINLLLPAMPGFLAWPALGIEGVSSYFFSTPYRTIQMPVIFHSFLPFGKCETELSNFTHQTKFGTASSRLWIGDGRKIFFHVIGVPLVHHSTKKSSSMLGLLMVHSSSMLGLLVHPT